MPSLASAQTTATVVTDLHLRAGPGPGYDVITVMPGGQGVVLEGCLEDSNWCQVTFAGQTGWAYGTYMAFDVAGERVILAEARPRIDIPVITFETAVIGAPVDAIAGAALAVPPPPEHVRTYVFGQQIEPVVLGSEVVVGATIPASVVLRPIPDYDFHWTYVNQRRVLVDPGTRRVVHIVG